jgi:hypothetical protein
MADPTRPNEERPSPTDADSTDADSYEEEELEIQIEQMDHPLGTEQWGTTAEEQRRGASLQERTSPDGPHGRRDDRGLQLSEEDVPDEESQLVGEASDDEESSDVSPEERAMHEDRDAPGGVWREGDDYVDESES